MTALGKVSDAEALEALRALTSTRTVPANAVYYSGSKTEFHGPATFVSYCYCDDCEKRYDEDLWDLRAVLRLPDGRLLENVRLTSFAAAVTA